MKISTAVSGTFSVTSLVASSPSMPGMRTSMITTLGCRRSASVTAASPSEASPMMRMCGAFESEMRMPSRTTSWSSTIRQVISGLPSSSEASTPGIVGVASYGARDGGQTASANCSSRCSSGRMARRSPIPYRLRRRATAVRTGSACALER